MTTERMGTVEAAAFLGISPKTLNAWNWTGKQNVPSYKAGRKRVYDRKELQAWLESRRAAGGAA